MFGLETDLTLLLILCLVAAAAFEFINGFHDTANAVATVIYTNSMKPTYAVIWSGFMNFLGVYWGGIAVAMGIIHLLPSAILMDQSVSHNIAMILALIITAIIWNLGTWYFGLPCSSSHTLLGSIFGVGLAYGLLPESAAVALNWSKVKDVGLSLLVSPIFGFGLTMLLVLLMKRFIKKNEIFDEPKKKKAPPIWIRSILISTCTLVSFFHGSNDGQKGVGLVMIILISLAPLHFALNHEKKADEIFFQATALENTINSIDVSKASATDKANIALIKHQIDTIQYTTTNIKSLNELDKDSHYLIRNSIMQISKGYSKLTTPSEETVLIYKLPKEQEKTMTSQVDELKGFVEYKIWWVLLIISLSLGLGTMIGWRRIVVTIGEKIGKEHLSYAQGASAELIAASTIGVSTSLGLPVSTTHVLSSGIAGSMVAKKGFKNLHTGTVRNILLAWVVTLPITIILSGGLFLLFRWLVNIWGM